MDFSFQHIPQLPHDLDQSAEAKHIRALLEVDLAQALSSYTDFRIEGVGGSGIVLSAVYQPFNVRRALKIPRIRTYNATAEKDTPPKGDPELHALSKASHKNIIRLYESHNLKGGNGHCIIMDYVSDSRPLHQFAKALCCSDDCRASDGRLRWQLKQFGGLLHELVDALVYLHDTATVYHFDVKPDNCLVSVDGWPFLTDLGFARDFSRYKADDEVEVGFTWKYAHPRLHEHGLMSQTAAKAKNSLKGADLSPAFDIFAFGRMLQEVLRTLKDNHGDHIHSFYEFGFLHVLACLCLDGKNARNYDMDLDPPYSFVSDQALGLPLALFKEHRFTNFLEVRHALKRLLGYYRLEDDVPELDRWSPHMLSGSDLGITTFTPRVKALIEHPVLQRLSVQNQLGMLDTVFPTASHTRLQHTLGVYHAAGQYILALYNDPENPVFRILLTPTDAKTVLLSALLHDVGQTTFGHEMEEIDKSVFHHVHYVKALIDQSLPLESSVSTIRDLIEKGSPDGWGVSADLVIGLLAKQRRRPLDFVLYDILDGQIDADKLDYLVRDSVECRVSYGHGIDCEGSSDR